MSSNVTKKLVIIGVGETADIAYEYFTYDSEYEIVAFSVHSKYITVDNYKGLPLVALETIEIMYPANEFMVFVALSSGKLNYNRTNLYQLVKSMGYSCATYISSRAFVWRSAIIGENCFIFENNVVQHGVEIGNNVILWSGNHIGHQSKIGNNVFISSHCVISGFCEIGENTFLGVNCTFADQIKIGRDCFIAMGSVVGKNLPDNTVIKPLKSEVAAITAKQLCKVSE